MWPLLAFLRRPRFTVGVAPASRPPYFTEMSALVQEVIAMVWAQDGRGRPRFGLHFYVRATPPVKGWPASIQDPLASYKQPSGPFEFYWQTIEEHSGGLSERLKQTLVLVAAHEAVHAIQCLHGRELVPDWGPGYSSTVHERAAWSQSLDVLKAVFPEIEDSFTECDGSSHRVPPRSSFSARASERARRAAGQLQRRVEELRSYTM